MVAGVVTASWGAAGAPAATATPDVSVGGGVPAATAGATEHEYTALPDAPPGRLGPAYDDDAQLAARPAPVASYDLHARLDAARGSIAGHGTVHWKNTSRVAVSELWLHLYLNAFKNSSSLFLRSPFSASRSGRRPERWGSIDVVELSAQELGGANLWSAARPETPGDEADETSWRVPLPQPVAPGGALSLTVRWSSQLPDIVERTGMARDYFMVGQWFPKLAVLRETGSWEHFPFHAFSEFFSDFGDYTVTLDTPAELIVGATGERVAERLEGQRRVSSYRARGVHDFAWTAWAHYREARDQVDGVEVRLLAPPGHGHNMAATLRAARAGLRLYGARFGKYPYRTLTIVHPPLFAGGAGGMEYPTLITTGGPWITSYLSSFVERVTVHELAHQWFYGLVASDEHTWPFLDEGLTSYAESVAMQGLFGTGSAFAVAGLTLDDGATLRTLGARAAHDGVVAAPAASFARFGDLASLVYARTASLLMTLGRVYGQANLDRALGRYARRYRWQHPTPAHLLGALRESLGDDASRQLANALFEGGWVNYVVADVSSVRARGPAGLFDGPAGRRTLGDEAAAGGRAQWLGSVLVYRRGTLELPVDVALYTESGERLLRHWNGRGRSTSLVYEGPERLVAAEVDPELRVVADDSLLDNALTTAAPSRGRVRERLLYWAQLALGWLGP